MSDPSRHDDFKRDEGFFSVKGIIENAFRLLATGMLGLLCYFGARVYEKADAAVDKAEMARVTESLWKTIGEVSKSATQLASTVAVLKEELTGHEVQDQVVKQNESDHEARIRLLEAGQRASPPPNR